MSVLDPQKKIDDESGRSPEAPEGESKRGGHGHWMMIACCIPMLAIAVAIVAAGGGAGFLIIAVACTAMMAMMMGGMSHGGEGR